MDVFESAFIDPPNNYPGYQAGALVGLTGQQSTAMVLGAGLYDVVATSVCLGCGGTWKVLFTAVNAPPSPSPIPLPAAIWFFGSGLVGVVGVSKQRTPAVD